MLPKPWSLDNKQRFKSILIMNRHWFFKLFMVSLLAIGLFGPALQVQSQKQALSNEVIEISMWIDNVYGFSVKDKTYNIQGSLLFTYPQFIQNKLKESDQIAGANIIDLVQFENMVEPWNSSFTPLYAAPKLLADKRLAQGYDFSGSFYSNSINFKNYPFGVLPLSVVLQPRVGASSDIGRNLLLKVASSGNGLGSKAGLSGYELSSWRFHNVANQSEIGLGSHGGKILESIVFEINYQINAFSSVVRWLLPLAIVMLLMLLTPNLRSSLCSDRLAIPPVVMLTVAFLQQAYRESLPSLPYLTFLDGLYTFSYVVTLAFFLLFIWASNCMDRVDAKSRDFLIHRIDKWDLRLQLVSISGFGFITVFAFWRF
ncbi:MAG: hypothetical protein EBR68_02550 [Synechococcaceae bacterium WB4_2_0811]|nr:hypothetical protein [Synechococcaceae bacterium WB4_2_0811]NBV69136.1 hypothetical protein [Synechococcaceae bacterium WB4_2_0805]